MFKRKNILVFRTSVEAWETVLKIKPLLDRLVEDTGRWNFDLEDCDRILRVESNHLIAQQVVDLLRKNGIFIKELEE
ncbi:hypothetical protein [Negadavirga shengliensis]|uniref:Uncharacterized protein n=1 Tax=Negadavirga shengliensis TaxID=1389218 RepID=A0ABV9T5S8_9BACT